MHDIGKHIATSTELQIATYIHANKKICTLQSRVYYIIIKAVSTSTSILAIQILADPGFLKGEAD